METRIETIFQPRGQTNVTMILNQGGVLKAYTFSETDFKDININSILNNQTELVTVASSTMKEIAEKIIKDPEKVKKALETLCNDKHQKELNEICKQIGLGSIDCKEMTLLEFEVIKKVLLSTLPGAK